MLKVYSFFNSFLKKMANHEPLGLDKVCLLGGRSSGKTTAVEEFAINACDLVDSDGYPISVSVLCFRKQLMDLGEVFEQYTNDLLRFNVSPNVIKSTMRYEFDNGNVVKFKAMGNRVNKMSLSGLAQSKGEYVIVIKEEAYEFTDADNAMITQAVRGNNPNCNMLTINIANPWFPKTKFINDCMIQFPYDERILKEKGHMETIKWVDRKAYKERILFMWVNWRAIQETLPEWKIHSILETYVTDPNNAKTADLGIPGICGSSVYGHLLGNVTEAQWVPHKTVAGGGDYASGSSKGSGKTAFVFGAWDANDKIDVLGEFVWDIRMKGDNDFIVAQAVVDWYVQMCAKYTKLTGVPINENYPIFIRVDFSASAFIDILVNETEKRGISGWLSFIPCNKYNISDRIFITRAKMGDKCLRISSECDTLLTELQLAQYKETNTKNVRADDNDHCINAFEYMIEDDMYDMLKGDPSSYSNIISRRGMKKLW